MALGQGGPRSKEQKHNEPGPSQKAGPNHFPINMEKARPWVLGWNVNPSVPGGPSLSRQLQNGQLWAFRFHGAHLTDRKSRAQGLIETELRSNLRDAGISVTCSA